VLEFDISDRGKSIAFCLEYQASTKQIEVPVYLAVAMVVYQLWVSIMLVRAPQYRQCQERLQRVLIWRISAPGAIVV